MAQKDNKKSQLDRLTKHPDLIYTSVGNGGGQQGVPAGGKERFGGAGGVEGQGSPEPLSCLSPVVQPSARCSGASLPR